MSHIQYRRPKNLTRFAAEENSLNSTITRKDLEEAAKVQVGASRRQDEIQAMARIKLAHVTNPMDLQKKNKSGNQE